MPAERERDYVARNVVRAVMSEDWLIVPEKLDAIVTVLEARANGIEFTESEIRDRIGDPRAEEAEPQIVNGVQVIDVFGTLAPRMNLMSRMSGGTSTQKLAKDIRAAGMNDDVRTIILRIDSPGGAASYTPEVAAVIREVAKTKRVVASATNMMASGAYWIGTAASEVYASPSTMVGSIGVYSIVQNAKEYYEREGIKFTVMRAGRLKAAGNPYEDMTEEQAQSLQKRVVDIYDDFLAAVAEHRNVSVAKVESSFGQGSVFLAPEAKDRNMIDGVMTFEEVLARELEQVAPSETFIQAEEDHMDPKMKAALFARGLVSSIDASDNECQIALRAFAAARNIEGDVTVDHIMANQPTPAPVQEPGDSRADARAAAQAAEAERERIIELRARGTLLGVSQEQIDEAIDNGTELSDAIVRWTENLARDRAPVTPVPGESQADKIAAGGNGVILSRLRNFLGDQYTEEDERNARQWGASFANRPLIDIVRTQLTDRGVRVTGDAREDAISYLETANISDGAVNRRGDHPDLLSSLTRKSLTAGAMIAEVTYPQWTARIEDLPDFKPKAFIDYGVFNRLDAVTEDGKIEQLKFDSDLQTWIAVDRYANSVGLTVEMLADDDLGGFVRQLRSLGMASRQTINRTILDLLNSNPTMPDGTAFFATARGNMYASGGAPGTAQLKTHRKTHRLLSSYGSDSPMGATIDGILVPAAWEEETLQTVSREYETKVPNTDATINTFRGRIRPVIESYLDGYSDKKWYSFIPTSQAAAVVYSFQRGFGEEGRREEWYDASRKTRYVSNEVRFGVAMANWRAMVLNPGQ